MAQDDNPVPTRSWSRRTFSRIGAGSVRGSICSLCCSAIGMGVLLLPYTVAQVGPLCTTVLLAAGCSVSYASLRICCAGMRAAGAHSYVDTLLVLFSERFAIALTAMLVVATFGLCCGYMVFASQLIQKLMQVAGMPPLCCNRSVIITVAACVMVFPMSLFRNLSDLRYLTLVSITGIICLTMVVVLRTPHYFSGDVFVHGWWWRVPHPWAVPKCFSLCFSAYVVHMNVFSCYAELSNPTPERMNKVLVRAAWLETALYVSISICGFLSFGADTPDNILQAYDLEDSSANVCRAFVSFQLLLCIPLTVQPARAYSWPLLCMVFGLHERQQQQPAAPDSEGVGTVVPVFVIRQKQLHLEANASRENLREALLPNSSGPRRMPLPTHVLLSMFLVASSALVAAKVESVSDLLGIVGGFAAVTYAFLLPAEMAQRLRHAPSSLVVDWHSSPAAFVRGPLGSLVILALRLCSFVGYYAAVQCAWDILSGKAG